VGTTGKVWPIRLRRPPGKGTVRLVGFMLTPRCGELIEKYAAKHGIAPRAAMSAIVERWVAKKKPKERKPK
jgi:hypothetical protein